MKSNGTFAIEVSMVFSATHQLLLAEGNEEPLHGHEWRATVRVEAQRLDAMETVLDFHEVERALQTAVGNWRGRRLNEVAPFAEGLNPSAERVAEEIGRRMVDTLEGRDAKARGVRIAQVRVTEAPGCVAIWLNTRLK